MKTTLIIILCLLLALSLGYNFMQSQQEGSEAAASADNSTGKQLYTCGMHPNVILDHPGICPICEMNLTPLKTGESRDDRDIHIDAATRQNIGVRTAEVRRKTLGRAIETNGIVKADENSLYTVSPKISGWIERLYVSETGQLIGRDNPLMDIYSPELVAAQEEYLLALASYDVIVNASNSQLEQTSVSLLDASRDRLLNWDFNQEQLDELEASGVPERLVTIYSPARGIVTHKEAVEGDYLKAGSQPFHIADLSSVWIEAEVYEYELPWVSVGQKVIITSPYDPDLRIESHVSFIYPYLNPSTRTTALRIVADNPEMMLKPEMYVDVSLQSRVSENALAVPREAVIRSGKRDVVFLAKDEGTFEPRQVKLGLESDSSYYEVLDGLSEGDNIVTSSQFLLDSEAQLQEALNRLLANGGSASEMYATMGHAGHGEPAQVEKKKVPEASGRTMEALYQTDDLYQCTEHHQIITEESGTVCPLDGKQLEKMSMKDIETLRNSDPYGCVMCPVIHPGSEKDERCVICNMKLKPVPHN